MYIPIMKMRQEEIRVSKKLNVFFSDDFIPLYEILNEEYDYKYEQDEFGNYLKILKPNNKRKTKIRKQVTEEDIITLEKVNEYVNGKKAFVDYFRFDADKYGGNKIDISKVKLAYTLSRNEDEYVKKISEVARYSNLIPVISIKDKFIFSDIKLIQLIKNLQSKSESIAIRIEDSLVDSVKYILQDNLREHDYLLYDIGQQNIDSRVVELMELEDLEIDAKKILLNCPRRSKLMNKEYENCEVTRLIDNSVAEEYENYGFDGFGDYGGLKDQLPTSGSNGKGAALALVYLAKSNSFYSFCNEDTSLGAAGYRQVIPDILNMQDILDEDNECIFFEKVVSMKKKNSTGNFAKWNNLTLSRYMHQIYKSK